MAPSFERPGPTDRAPQRTMHGTFWAGARGALTYAKTGGCKWKSGERASSLAASDAGRSRKRRAGDPPTHACTHNRRRQGRPPRSPWAHAYTPPPPTSPPRTAEPAAQGPASSGSVGSDQPEIVGAAGPSDLCVCARSLAASRAASRHPSRPRSSQAGAAAGAAVSRCVGWMARRVDRLYDAVSDSE